MGAGIPINLVKLKKARARGERTGRRGHLALYLMRLMCTFRSSTIPTWIFNDNFRYTKTDGVRRNDTTHKKFCAIDHRPKNSLLKSISTYVGIVQK